MRADRFDLIYSGDNIRGKALPNNSVLEVEIGGLKMQKSARDLD